MRTSPLPHTGPIVLDCCSTSGPIALRRVETTLKRLRGGARTLVVRTNMNDVIDTVTRWARVGHARHEVVASGTWTELRIYLLPRDFDEHPFLAWRPPLPNPVRLDEHLANEYRA
jgi:hypothetical protein